VDDFATLPGGIYLGGPRGDAFDADASFPAGVFDNLILTFGGNDTVHAGQGNDAVMLGTGNDYADGGAGRDILLGQQGDDTLLGGEGNDVLLGGEGKDQLDGGEGDDLVAGGMGHDVLSGGGGNDVIFGDMGHDVFAGGAGDDTIIGGQGHDTITGGSGQDVFFFESGFGKDVVLDFEKGVDSIAIEANINGLRISSPEDLAPYISGNASYSEIKLHGDTIKLVGVSKEDLLGNLCDYVKIV
jgi:Ca2+-binding RTX toxin-like protein